MAQREAVQPRAGTRHPRNLRLAQRRLIPVFRRRLEPQGGRSHRL